MCVCVCVYVCVKKGERVKEGKKRPNNNLIINCWWFFFWLLFVVVVVVRTHERSWAEPHQIVATRLLYCLQYPDLSKSSTSHVPPFAVDFLMHPERGRTDGFQSDSFIGAKSWHCEGTEAHVLLLSWHSLRRFRRRKGQLNIIALSSVDSDLEAFSRNPTRGSFAPMSVQTSALPITW